jgi:hypothetical protein
VFLGKGRRLRMFDKMMLRTQRRGSMKYRENYVIRNFAIYNPKY